MNSLIVATILIIQVNVWTLSTCLFNCIGVLMLCSQILSTLNPLFRRCFVIMRSRSTLPAIFVRQYFTFCFGMRQHFKQPCQKQPSMKTASLGLGKKKSGQPANSFLCSDHPFICARTRAMRNFNSVDRLPRARTLAITELRFLGDTLSMDLT